MRQTKGLHHAGLLNFYILTTPGLLPTPRSTHTTPHGTATCPSRVHGQGGFGYVGAIKRLFVPPSYVTLNPPT